MPSSFTADLTQTIVENLFNDYKDNHDTYRFGPAGDHSSSLKNKVRRILQRIGYYNPSTLKEIAQRSIESFSEQVNYFSYLYDLLENESSRKLLVQVCAYRILGESKIKLPANKPEFWSTLEFLENKVAEMSDFIQTNFNSWKLYKHDLKALRFPLVIYSTPYIVYLNIVSGSWSYSQDDVAIGVQPGDHVIDAGACYGDTSLLFAHLAGEAGRVYAFEFEAENLVIYQRNMAMNPLLKNRITLFDKPLWSTGGISVSVNNNGPGTKVTADANEKQPGKKLLTISIDGLVRSGAIEKVDFIKMDIEGAEIEVLKGAKETIVKYRPKLALSLYHSPQDFQRIPEFIKGLGLGYKFYFNHCTMHAEESILFCMPDNR